jgi:hypothetical protein
MSAPAMGRALPARILLGAAALAALAAAASGLPALPTKTASAAVLPAGGTPPGWRLRYAESFDTSVSDSSATWFRDGDGPGSTYNVDGYDDDGAFFDAKGGTAFRQQLSTFATYRKSFAFGTSGWLTAELSDRDSNRDGRPDSPPSLTTKVVGGSRSAVLSEPDYQGGIVIRSTAALPSTYRVEMTLRTVDFGGQRNGSWTYPDGRVNGYSPTGCKTNFPWATSGDFSRKPCDWTDVRTDSNGFYFLGIMDYPRPAPHNNVFVHTHRKVSMDGYNRYQYTDTGSVLCDPSSKVFQPYSSGTGNGVNMIFETAARRYAGQPGTEYLMESECGLRTSGAIVSQAELRPELMPNETYRFAIERAGGGYTLEMTGTFARIGKATLRYHRAFVQDGLPIWHYNQTAAEYGGAYNADWTYKGPYGTYTDHSVWPAGSAYPDYFMIGDPHTNFYEGSASVDDIRLYVPAG